MSVFKNMFDVIRRIRPEFSVNSLLVLILAYILVVDNFTFWSMLIGVLDMSIVSHVLFVVAFFILLFTLTLFFLLFVSFRRILKPVLALVLILAAGFSYFMSTYGAVISVSMLHNVAETDYNEAFDLLTFGLFLHVFVFGVIPALLISRVELQYKPWRTELLSRTILFVVCVVIATSTVFVSYKDFTYVIRQNRDLRFFINPLFPMVSVYKFTKETLFAYDDTLKTVFSDAVRNIKVNTNDKKTVMVMVLGETARASQFHLNGYEKNTTPQLSKNAGRLINFKNTYSCGTATAESVPCMFSALNHDNFDKAEAISSENLMDALKYAGIDVLWKENDGGCKGVCDRVNTQYISIDMNSVLCNEEECFDEILLSGLDKHLETIQTDAVIVLHQKGSHGPAYYKRYPEKFEVFTPVCKTKAVQDCSREEITNAYNNTILYTDHVLSEVIKFLEHKSDKFNTAMLYMSDHGESLGEKGIYLHGLPYYIAPDEQTHVPFIMWLSDGFSNSRNIDMNCLRERSQAEKYSHDNLVHSVLGAMDVQTRQYNEKLDIFSSCGTLNKRTRMVQADKQPMGEVNAGAL